MSTPADVARRLLSTPASKSEQAYWRLARDLEEVLLTTDQMPAEVLEVFLMAFRDHRVNNHPGIGHFANALQTEFEKLNCAQRRELLDAIAVGAPAYARDVDRLCIADFIARRYPDTESLDFFKKLAADVSGQVRQLALAGCEVLRQQARTSNAVREAAIDICLGLRT